MGSGISSAIAARAPLMGRDCDWGSADEDDPNRGPFLHELPLDEQERLVQQRWMEERERNLRKGACVSPRPKYERDREIALPHVLIALHHYNSLNPGAPFDLVDPFKCNQVGFRDEIWIHLNFSARPSKKRDPLAGRRSAPPDTAVQYFFAELHYGCCSDTPVVETCIILEKQLDQCKLKCAFCKGWLGIYHPSNGENVCLRSGMKKEYYQVCMWRKMPNKYIVPKEDCTSAQRLFDELPLAA